MDIIRTGYGDVVETCDLDPGWQTHLEMGRNVNGVMELGTFTVQGVHCLCQGVGLKNIKGEELILGVRSL
jgi:hypothetical protein